MFDFKQRSHATSGTSKVESVVATLVAPVCTTASGAKLAAENGRSRGSEKSGTSGEFTSEEEVMFDTPSCRRAASNGCAWPRMVSPNARCVPEDVRVRCALIICLEPSGSVTLRCVLDGRRRRSLCESSECGVEERSVAERAAGLIAGVGPSVRFAERWLLRVDALVALVDLLWLRGGSKVDWL